MEENTTALEKKDDMNGDSMVSEFMNQKIPSKPSKNVANNVNTKSVRIVDGPKNKNLDSDESFHSLSIDINTEADDMVGKVKDSELDTFISE